MSPMSSQDREELREFLREAVVAGLRDHPCRFGSVEAAVLHEAAKRLSADDIIAVAWIAHRLQGVGEAAGKWFGKLVVAGLVGLVVAGAAALAWGVRRGWVSPIGP